MNRSILKSLRVFWLSALIYGALSTTAVSTTGAWQLMWTYTPNVEDGFRIYRQLPGEPGFTLLAQTSKDARAFTDIDRTIGSCFALVAFNALGESPRINACATLPAGVQVLILQ